MSSTVKAEYPLTWMEGSGDSAVLAKEKRGKEQAEKQKYETDMPISL